MLKTVVQTEMRLSPYEGLYEAIIPTNHMLRRLKENIDFSFVKRYTNMNMTYRKGFPTSRRWKRMYRKR